MFDEDDTYSGCSDTFDITSGKHTVTLRKREAPPIQVVVNISPGHHLLTFLPEKDLVKWDNTSFQVGPGRTVTIASENDLLLQAAGYQRKNTCSKKPYFTL
ncbi:MAG: hypothetical protein MZU91_06190 [Desulfosudis oleivorans]|nr:hypothetical protein [Desulfosudis oleivorans]